MPHTPYIPDIIPEGDRKALMEKYHSGHLHSVGFGKSPALLVVDMTDAFVTDDYPTGFARTGVPCARAIRRLADACRGAKIPVIFTRGLRPTSAGGEAEMGRWVHKSSMAWASPDGNSIHKELAPADGDIVIEKAKPSAFFGTQLPSVLNFLAVDTLVVTGMVTAGCVRATVVDAFSYNYRVIIPEECVADRSQISHEVNLFDMDMKYADVVKLVEVLAWIKGGQRVRSANVMGPSADGSSGRIPPRPRASRVAERTGPRRRRGPRGSPGVAVRVRMQRPGPAGQANDY